MSISSGSIYWGGAEKGRYLLVFVGLAKDGKAMESAHDYVAKQPYTQIVSLYADEYKELERVLTNDERIHYKRMKKDAMITL